MKPATSNPAPEVPGTAPASHTAGPWCVRALAGFPLQIATAPDADGFGIPIADVSYAIHPQEAEANARLMASAPDLLHALRAMMRWSGALPPSDSRDLPDFTEAEAVCAARAAIAAALAAQ